MNDNLLTSLNDVQREAVLHTEGPLLILAGAGSGKTRVIIHRIAYLLKDCRVSPFRILAVTFTNKAANEMKERLDALAGEGTSRNVWVATFHATCARILRRDIEKLRSGGLPPVDGDISDEFMNHGIRTGEKAEPRRGVRSSVSRADTAPLNRNFTIFDAGEQATLVRDILRQLQVDEKRYNARAILSHISRAKNERLQAAKFTALADNPFEYIAAQIYPIYQNELRKNNAVDFDDLLLLTIELFNTNPDVLKSYQDKFEYLLVDEYQDTNPSQYELVRLLAGTKQNLCVVGDDDQAIYTFRGADIRNILDFEKDYPHTHVLRLEQNYRSVKNILDAAWHVIDNNTRRRDKKLWTKNETGEPLICYEAMDENDEVGFVVKQIEDWHADGVNYSDFAIFYRTNTQSRKFEEAFNTAKIPYQIIGGIGFYNRMEIKDLLAYLRIMCNRGNSMSIRRVINVPSRGIGATTLQRLIDFAATEELSLFDAIQRVAENPEIDRGKQMKVRRFAKIFDGFDATDFPSDALPHVLKTTGYLKRLAEQNSIEAQNRIENIEELMNAIAEYENSADEPSLADYLENVALSADIDTMKTDKKTDMVPLMTLHSAKGLEFPFVFIVGMEEGFLPHQRSISNEHEVEEERRLCYVGMTRAMEQLYLLHVSSRRMYGETEYRVASRFISEIPETLIKHVERYSSPFRETEALYRIHEKAESLNYQVHQIVSHPKFGRGKITKISGYGEEAFITVRFQRAGLKQFVAGYRLLQPA